MVYRIALDGVIVAVAISTRSVLANEATNGAHHASAGSSSTCRCCSGPVVTAFTARMTETQHAMPSPSLVVVESVVAVVKDLIGVDSAQVGVAMYRVPLVWVVSVGSWAVAWTSRPVTGGRLCHWHCGGIEALQAGVRGTVTSIVASVGCWAWPQTSLRVMHPVLVVPSSVCVRVLCLVGLLGVIGASHGFEATLSWVLFCYTVSNARDSAGRRLTKVVRTWGDVALWGSVVVWVRPPLALSLWGDG